MTKSRLLQVSEAAELIENVTGTPRFEIAKRINNAGQFRGLRFFSKQGLPVSWMPGVYRVIEDNEGRLNFDDMPYFRVDIGELMAALDYHPETQTAILAELESPSPEAKPIPIPRQRLQETEILRFIQETGHDAQSLPNRERGKPGVKAETRKLALRNAGLFTASSFDKAWFRLRADGRIIGGN